MSVTARMGGSMQLFLLIILNTVRNIYDPLKKNYGEYLGNLLKEQKVRVLQKHILKFTSEIGVFRKLPKSLIVREITTILENNDNI